MRHNTAARSSFSRGYLTALAGTVIWSTTGIFIRYLTDVRALPPLVLAFWRDLIVFSTFLLIFLVFSPKRLRVARKDMPFLLLYGFVLSFFNTLYTVSVALNGAGVSTVLAYSSAAFTALLGWRIFGEKFDAVKISALVLSLAGCVFVSGALDPAVWRLNPLGIITGILSGVAFAVYSLFGKEASNREIYPWSTMMYMFGIAAIFLFFYNFIGVGEDGWLGIPNFFSLGSSLNGWLLLILLSVGPTIGGYGLYNLSLSYLPASVANLIATLEPAFTVGMAYLLLGERMTLPQMMGGAMIICGVILLRLGEGRQNALAVNVGD